MKNIYINRLLEYTMKRKTLLWIIKEPVDLGNISEQTIALAKLYWEACWTEDTRDLFYDASKNVADKAPRRPESGVIPRQPYRLSSDPDKPGEIDRHAFLPIYEVNGSSRLGELEGRNDIPKTRRNVYRLNQMRKLEEFDGFALVVVGAEKLEDLALLSEALEFSPPGMELFLVWPETLPAPESALTAKIIIHTIRPTLNDFLSELTLLGAPEAESSIHLGIRYGRTEVEVSEADFGELRDAFNIITTKDLITGKQTKRSFQEQLATLRESDSSWEPFTTGVVFEREYFVNKEVKDTLSAFISRCLKDTRDNSDSGNMTISIPATSGSGITTTLRAAGFLAASEGFPTLVCRSCCKSFSVDRVLSFLTTLRERSSYTRDVPSLIIFDREHHSLEDVNTLASNLGARGRSTIIVQVIPPNSVSDLETEHESRPIGKHKNLPVFVGVMQSSEIRSLANHFNRLFQGEGSLSPTLPEWEAFQSKNAFTSFVSSPQPETLFWVALQFFLQSRNPSFDVSGWILRVCDQEVPSQKSKRALRIMAAYSAFGIPVPLTSLMRSLGSNVIYDSEVISVFNRLTHNEEVLEWFPRELDIEDQAIGFKHRLLALKLLELLRIRNWFDPLEECRPVLELLKPTSAADSWLLEVFAFEALKPARGAGESTIRLNRILDTFNAIPSVLADRSQALQHHWGRTLQQLSRSTDITEKKVKYLSEAVGKLIFAVELTERHRGREHPRNVLNTLGSVLAELSIWLRTLNRIDDAERAWQDSADAFERALGFGADNYITLSAYAHRLIDHAIEPTIIPETKFRDLALANTLLIRALEFPGIPIEDEQTLLKWQLEAYRLSDESKGSSFLNDLKQSDPELWSIIEAQGKLRKVTQADWQEGTKPEFTEAFEILNEVYSKGGVYTWRLLYLLYKIASSIVSKRFDFAYRLALLDKLALTQFKWDVKSRFAHCVMCYQIGDFSRGEVMFRSLRTILNSGQLNPRQMNSFWRDAGRPDLPKIATIRIVRIDTDWRAYGEVSEMNGQRVLLRPRLFIPEPKLREVRQCCVTFGIYGPIAVPQNREFRSVIN